MPNEDDDEVYHTKSLREAKVFLSAREGEDIVLLRVRAGEEPNVWYRLHREDFLLLASYLAENAASMSPNRIGSGDYSYEPRLS